MCPVRMAFPPVAEPLFIVYNTCAMRVKTSAAILAVSLLFSFCPLVRVLSVKGEGRDDEKSSIILLSREAARTGFIISYTHSVNKGRVRDFYACEGTSLVLEKTLFTSYGAGMPEAGEDPGEGFSVTGAGYELAGMNRRMDGLNMAVGLTARHSLAVRQQGGEGMGQELYLEDVFAKQSAVQIRVRRVSLLYCLLARKLSQVV